MCLPRLARKPALTGSSTRDPVVCSTMLSWDDTAHFMRAYNNPAFGWHAASVLHRSGTPDFPVFPERKLRWVHLAWLQLCRPDLYRYDQRFEPVRQALQIHTQRENEDTRGFLEAALMTSQGTAEELGQRIGWPALAIEAYDALFWNVRDRQADKLFLRNVVYPNTRLEELIEDYLPKGNLNKVLLRMGYNKDLDTVMHFAGFGGNDFIGGMSCTQATDMFQREVMVQGYLLASNGFLNYEKQHVSMTAARSLLQAAKIGGADTGGETSAGIFAEVMATQLEQDGSSDDDIASYTLLVTIT